MNEYLVTARVDGEDREFTIEAHDALEARELVESENDVEILQVRLQRQLSFSCRIRDGRR